MDKKSIYGLVLIFALMVGYSYWRSPSADEKRKMEQARTEALAQQQKMVDSIAQAKINAIGNDTTQTAVASTSNAKINTIDSNNAFSQSLEGTKEIYKIENEVFKIQFQNLGGRITDVALKDYLTYDKKPVLLMDEAFSDFYFSFFANNRNVNTKDLYFQYIAPAKNTVTDNDSVKVRMRIYPNSNKQVLDTNRYMEFVYTIYGDQYMIGFDIRMVGLEDIIAANTNFIDLNWKANLHQYEKALAMEQANTAVYYKPTTNDVDYLSETKDDAESIKTPLKWVSFKQQFFCVTLIADDAFLNADIENKTQKKAPKGYLKDVSALIGIPYTSSNDQSIGMRIYMGPNKYSTMRAYDLDLERQIPLGWSFFLMQWINRVAVIPTFDFLSGFNISYGIIILILTILLKIILFPITYKSYVSSAKMRVIKPETDEIAKKFAKPEQAMEKQKATMTLYKKAGINPMSGCIPMLVQFPILLAMFRFFPASIELRQQHFLWADDLSSYDSIATLPFDIPFYGSHISLFAILMAISNLLYTHMTMKQSAGTNQMPGMKMMMYIMPIMFLGFLNSYSAALNYYYFLSTLITFGQMWMIRQFMNDAKVRLRIQEQKKKPIVKSKFQKRLEEMARQQQATQNKR
ncbi:MAG: membrane protein insertase YidC [Bacteroidales bacterium]